MADYRADIEFVFQELIRFHSLSFAELGKLPPLELLSTLRSGGMRGMMIIGQAANKRLFSLAEQAVANSIHNGRLDTNEVVKHLKEILVSRFIDVGRELDQSQADRAVSFAIRQAAQAKTNLTHFLPCTLGTGLAPETIEFGPVILMRREFMLREYALPLGVTATHQKPSTVESDAQKPETQFNFIENARKYLEEFDWIAKVKIDDCDPVVSAKRAEFAVQCAIDCLHLILGSDFSNHLRVAGPVPSVAKTARLVLKSDGTAFGSFGRSWPMNALGDGWWDTANKAVGPGTIATLGKAISARTIIPDAPPMALRFFDAAAWFGEAIRDSYLPSRIVKFVTAMERLLCTKKEDEVTKVISQRGAALLALSKFDSFESYKARIKEIYDVRSSLVHGTRSNSAGRLGLLSIEAETLAQYLLLCGVQFFGEEGLFAFDVDDSMLANNYERLLPDSEGSTLA